MSKSGTIFTAHYVSFSIIYRENLKSSNNNAYNPEAFQNYSIKDSLDGLKVLDSTQVKLPWSTFIGVLGMPGK